MKVFFIGMLSDCHNRFCLGLPFHIISGICVRFMIGDLLIVDTHLQLVKTKSIDTVDVALGDDGFAVGLLDDAEDVHTLVLAAHDQEYLDRILGVPASAFKDGAAAMGLRDDIVGDLLPLLADNLELHALACVVDNAVGSNRIDDHEDETIHNLVDGVEQQP